MGWRVKIDEDLYEDHKGGASSSSPFVTVGADGIITERWQTAGGYVYDMFVGDDGAWGMSLVSTPVVGGTFSFVDGTPFEFVDGTFFDFVT